MKAKLVGYLNGTSMMRGQELKQPDRCGQDHVCFDDLLPGDLEKQMCIQEAGYFLRIKVLDLSFFPSGILIVRALETLRV